MSGGTLDRASSVILPDLSIQEDPLRQDKTRQLLLMTANTQGGVGVCVLGLVSH